MFEKWKFRGTAVIMMFVCILDMGNSAKSVKAATNITKPTVTPKTGNSAINKNTDEGWNYHQNVAWTYTCVNGNCLKQKVTKNATRVSLETCNMLCGSPLLWPKPSRLQINGNNSAPFHKHHIGIKITTSYDNVRADLQSAVTIFMKNLPELGTPLYEDLDVTHFQEKQILQINIVVEGNETKPQLSTSESYSLVVKNVQGDSLAVISAETYFGARHGLETLSQLIWFDTEQKKLKIVQDVEIHDQPTFPHRGLMIDTARNYFPIEQLLKVVDGMAASKLNVLHLHLTDSVSFPVILPNNPKFAKFGAYSPQMVYTPDNVKGLIEYARIRGIRVILEIDAPGHVNEGWNHDEELVICGKEDVFNGHLNPDNRNIQMVLQSIYRDLLELGTDQETFHIGGDEVNLNCWSGITATKGYSDLHEFWANFTNKMLFSVKEAFDGELPDNVVLWSSSLTEKKLEKLNFSENVVVQHTHGKVYHYLDANHKVIFSEAESWYLDCGFGSWRSSMPSGNCDPYRSWQEFYKHRPWAVFPNHITQVLGGETCLWTEQVDVDSLEIRIWPRAAAVAERLWSDPPNFKDYDVYTRLASQRERLLKRGLKSDAMWPRWCYKNPRRC